MIDNYNRLLKQASVDIMYARKTMNDGEDLFVINTCDLNGTTQKGDLKLKITIKGSNKGLKLVSVPDTWIPWNLSRYASKDIWLQDSDFIDLVDKGYVTIVENDFAETVLNTDEAITERDRLYARERQLAIGTESEENVNNRILGQSADRDIVKEFVERNKKVSQIIEKKQSITEEKYQPSIKLVSIINQKNLDETSKINALMNMVGELNTKDFNYIMNNLTTKETKIKDWVLTQRKNK